jgi:hypothetical protein
MFVLRYTCNPMPSELGDWSPWDLLEFVNVRFFRSPEAALAFLEKAAAGDNEANRAADPEWTEDCDMRLVDADENNGTTTWVFGTHNSEPYSEGADMAEFWWASLSPVEFEEDKES